MIRLIARGIKKIFKGEIKSKRESQTLEDRLDLSIIIIAIVLLIGFIALIALTILPPWYNFSLQNSDNEIDFLLIFTSPIIALYIFWHLYSYAASEESKFFLFIAKFLTLAVFLYSVWISIPTVFQDIENISVFEFSLAQKVELERITGIVIQPVNTAAGCLIVGAMLEFLERLGRGKNL